MRKSIEHVESLRTKYMGLYTLYLINGKTYEIHEQLGSSSHPIITKRRTAKSAKKAFTEYLSQYDDSFTCVN